MKTFRRLGAMAAALALTAVGASTTLAGTSAAPQRGVYVVQAGDTLADLSKRFGVSAQQIRQMNRMKTSDTIYDGKQLNLPDAAFLSAAVTPKAEKTKGKFIFVSIATQKMTVYQNGKLVKTFKVSTGETEKPTKIGNYRVKTKLDSAWSRSWQLTMPKWLGIYDIFTSENGIHALPINTAGRKMWGGLIGSRVSYGCIVLKDADQAWLYDFADIGTPVIIRN